MDEKIRVMHVAGGIDVGGADQLLWITASYNLEEKYDLAFTSCFSNDGFISRQIQKLGYQVYGLNVTQRVYDLRLIPRLIQVFQSYRPHIVHFYFKVGFLGRIAAKIAGVPIIICNEVDMDWEKYGLGLRFIATAKRKSDFLADKIIACSEAVRQYWDKNNSPKYSIMYLPIDMNKLTDIEIHTNGELYKNGPYPVIGIITRIHPGKGHEDLIRAMPKILQVFPGAKLRIVGRGSLLSQMQQLAITLGVGTAVEFTGFVEDVNLELSTMDVFVLPSLTEGFPLSIMEAMAMGLPVAATPVGGIPELIEPGQTGLLFPTRNPDALADAVIQILSDPKKARKMGEMGRQKVVNEYTPEQYIQQLDDLYQEMLAVKGIR